MEGYDYTINKDDYSPEKEDAHENYLDAHSLVNPSNEGVLVYYLEFSVT